MKLRILAIGVLVFGALGGTVLRAEDFSGVDMTGAVAEQFDSYTAHSGSQFFTFAAVGDLSLIHVQDDSLESPSMEYSFNDGQETLSIRPKRLSKEVCTTYQHKSMSIPSGTCAVDCSQCLCEICVVVAQSMSAGILVITPAENEMPQPAFQPIRASGCTENCAGARWHYRGWELIGPAMLI
jgi:hypothetical protein